MLFCVYVYLSVVASAFICIYSLLTELQHIHSYSLLPFLFTEGFIEYWISLMLYINLFLSLFVLHLALLLFFFSPFTLTFTVVEKGGFFYFSYFRLVEVLIINRGGKQRKKEYTRIHVLEMESRYLVPAERELLSQLLFDSSSSFGASEKVFKKIFPASSYTAVCGELEQMCKEYIESTEGIALIGALYLMDSMRKEECLVAKAALYGILVDLERAMRRDMFVSEQVKYATKDSKDGKKAMEAIRAEVYRIHCAAKVFTFQLLADSVSGDEKAQSYVSKKQESIDEALGAWEKASVKLKEPMSDMEHCWLSEREKQQCGAMYSSAAVFDDQTAWRSALTLPSAPVKIPMLPLQPGELQYLLPGASSLLLFDGSAPSEQWSRCKKLMDAACKAVLSKESDQNLAQLLTKSIVSKLGVSSKLLVDLATYNPGICAAVLLKVPDTAASAFIQSLLKSSAPDDNLQTVLLHASTVLQQVNVRTFISTTLHKLKDRASNASSASDDGVKGFSLTLHQLVTKASKENKEIYIADVLKSELEQLFLSTNLPDIKTRWEEMKR